jgi:hypothetical protein
MRSMSVSSDEKTIDSSSSNDLSNSNCRIPILVEDLKNPELLETTWQDKP